MPDDLMGVIEVLDRAPKPRIDKVSVHCAEELGALMVMFGSSPAPWAAHFLSRPMFGVPIVIDDDVSPGMVRLSLNDEVVNEIVI